MGWLYFHDTGEFLGETLADDPALPDWQNIARKRKAVKLQIEKAAPGTIYEGSAMEKLYGE